MHSNPTGAEEKMNVELIMPIGAVVIAMFLWLLIVFVIRNRKRVTLDSIPLLVLSLSLLYAHKHTLLFSDWLEVTVQALPIVSSAHILIWCVT